jgi:large subunit ribosomal protein L9
MKVYLLQSIEKVGIAGEIITVSEGYAQNFLFPRKMAMKVTDGNKEFFEKKAKTVDHRKEVIESETSMLSERIKDLVITLKKKIHDDNRLYASINPIDIVEALAAQQIKISKSQVIFEKSIKAVGNHQITIKLSSKLQPQMTVKVVGLTEK